MTKIIYKKGDVTEAPEEIIAHGCNALGVMGSGVAAAIRAKFPLAYSEYVAAHRSMPLQVGECILVHCGDKYIANLITQATTARYPGEVVISYSGIRQSLEMLNLDAAHLGVSAIAMPRIGAGLGGGDWNQIAVIIEETSLDYQPVVYDL